MTRVHTNIRDTPGGRISTVSPNNTRGRDGVNQRLTWHFPPLEQQFSVLKEKDFFLNQKSLKKFFWLLKCHIMGWGLAPYPLSLSVTYYMNGKEWLEWLTSKMKVVWLDLEENDSVTTFKTFSVGWNLYRSTLSLSKSIVKCYSMKMNLSR